MAILDDTRLGRFYNKLKARFVRGVSISGSTLTITKGDNSTSTLELPNATISVATQTKEGLMSSADKSKINGIQANPDSVTFTRSLSSGLKVGSISINGTSTDLYVSTDSITVTASTQTDWSGNPAGDDASGSVLTRVVGVPAGTYTLSNLLQRLVTISHTHGTNGITAGTDRVD